MPTFIAHYHEIGLKGGNRPFFESRLKQNLQRALSGVEGLKVQKARDHMRVHFSRPEDVGEVENKLARVLGVVHFSLVESVAVEFEAVQVRAAQWIQEELATLKVSGGEKVSFRVQVHRSDKTFGMTSMEIARRLSAALLPQFPLLKVDLETEDMVLRVDWGREEVRLSLHKQQGMSGLPVGVSGKLVSLLSAGFDSPVASWMMMRRGAKLVFVHFHSYPATGRESIDNVEELVRILNQYQFESKLYLIPLVEYQKEVVAKAPAEYRTLLYRRMMMRLAQRVTRFEQAKGLITGESLAQVASQTLDNLHTVDSVATRPVYRPLIGTDKEEIIRWARRIGTHDTSSQPYQDCCTLYADRSPALTSTPALLESFEEKLDIQMFEKTLWEQREVKKFGTVEREV